MVKGGDTFPIKVMGWMMMRMTSILARNLNAWKNFGEWKGASMAKKANKAFDLMKKCSKCKIKFSLTKAADEAEALGKEFIFCPHCGANEGKLHS